MHSASKLSTARCVLRILNGLSARPFRSPSRSPQHIYTTPRKGRMDGRLPTNSGSAHGKRKKHRRPRRGLFLAGRAVLTRAAASGFRRYGPRCAAHRTERKLLRFYKEGRKVDDECTRGYTGASQRCLRARARARKVDRDRENEDEFGKM
jgi:hypothetical protein